jgi:Ca2+-binding EF-hand superfamily protein
MREAFQILDRDSDGMVNREDVVDMLNQLGTWDTYVHDAEHLC